MGCHGVFGEDLKNACLLKKRDFRNKMIIYLDASLLNFILGRNPGINTPFQNKNCCFLREFCNFGPKRLFFWNLRKYYFTFNLLNNTLIVRKLNKYSQKNSSTFEVLFLFNFKIE